MKGINSTDANFMEVLTYTTALWLLFIVLSGKQIFKPNKTDMTTTTKERIYERVSKEGVFIHGDLSPEQELFALREQYKVLSALNNPSSKSIIQRRINDMMDYCLLRIQEIKKTK